MRWMYSGVMNMDALFSLHMGQPINVSVSKERGAQADIPARWSQFDSSGALGRLLETRSYRVAFIDDQDAN